MKDGRNRICGCEVCGKKRKQRNMGCKVPILQTVCSDCQRKKDGEGWMYGCGVEGRGGMHSLLQLISRSIYSDVLFACEVSEDEGRMS